MQNGWMNSHPPMPYWALSSFYFAYFAVLGLYTPFFSLYLEDQGHSTLLISLLMSIWFGSRMVSPSVWGVLTDRAASPVQWLRWGVAGGAMTFAFLLLPLPLFALVGVITLYSLLFNAVMPQFETITLSHLGPRNASYGRIRLWGSVGFIVTAAAFGPVFEFLPIASLPIWMLLFMLLCVASAWRNDYGPGHGRHSGNTRPKLGPAIRQREVLAFLLAALLMQLGHGPYYVFFSIYLDQHQYSSTAIGAYWAWGVASEIAMFMGAQYILRRISATRLAQICLLVAVMRWFLIACLPDHPYVMVVAQSGHAFTFGAFHAAAMQLMVRFFPGRLMIHGQALLYGFSSGLGGVLGSLLAGVFWQWGGGQATFLLSAVASLVGLLIALWGIQPQQKNWREVHRMTKHDDANAGESI